MSESMPFPTNWKEFLQEYSFLDIREVYTNGSRLIPVFRVEQMIEHFHNDWISVEDRLPNEYENVLTYGARSSYDVVYVNRLINKENGEWLYDGVTHWIPIPPLPKEDKDDT